MLRKLLLPGLTVRRAIDEATNEATDEATDEAVNGRLQLMLILGIESSCDETGVALVEAAQQGAPTLLADALHSQIDMHRAYGGVVPELASRDHIRRVIPLLQQVLRDADCALSDLDAIAYTRGPGLAGALLVGAGVANSLAAALAIPTIAVHHLHGHLLSPFLSDDPPQFPYICLLVSGGHTQLMRVAAVGEYELLGETIDDAAGEAFDKSAKLLGLPYPGGPELAKLAERGNPDAFSLPRPLLKGLRKGNLDFSFAGLKTAVFTHCRKLGISAQQPPDTQQHADLAASTQAAIVDVLVKKSLQALNDRNMQRLVVAGGVAANRHLRARLADACGRRGIRVHYPELRICTDNGAMIAWAAAMQWQCGSAQLQTDYAFDVYPRWEVAASAETG